MKTEAKLENMGFNEIKVAHHEHELKLVNDETHYNCNGCKELGFGGRYTCNHCACNYNLHKDCARALNDKSIITTPSIRPSKYPGNDYCVFLQQPPDHDSRSCDICTGPIRGFVYHQFDKDLDFHPTCANLPHHEYIATHDGEHMTFTLSDQLSSKCFRCGKKKLNNKRIKPWCYVSNCKEYQIHVHCMKEMMSDALEEDLHGNGCSGGTDAKESKSQALEAASKAQTVVDISKAQTVVDIEKKKKGGGKFGKLKKIAQIAISLILAVLVGDPTALVATFIAAIISN